MINKEIRSAGIGLRTQHAMQILDLQLDIPWLEVLIDNWMVDGGLNHDLLLALSERYPITFHGVNLSLGSINPLNRDYIAKIKQLKQQTGACWYSEHVSFSHVGDHYLPDLLPLPYTDEAVRHLSQRIVQVQDLLGERLVIENVSAYIECTANTMTESEFLAAVLNEADCYLLLDLNNIVVSCSNLGQKADDFIADIPIERVKEIHLAGYENKGGYLLDAHNQPVSDDVWMLYSQFIKKAGPIPTLIEWDNDLPEIDILLLEQKKAQRILDVSRGHTTEGVV